MAESSRNSFGIVGAMESGLFSALRTGAARVRSDAALPSSSNERGFTLVELLVTMSIIGILAALSLSAFFVYKDKAEYAKAETDLRTAIIAFEIGDQEAQPGDTLALTYSPTTGGQVPAGMESFMPNAVTSKGIELGAQYQYCDSNDPPLSIKMYLTAESCSANKRVEWTRFCGGAEVRLDNLPGGNC